MQRSNKDRNEIKRWVRATGINTSEIVAKIFFLSLLKVEDAVHDQEEEYLKTIQEMVSNLKTGKKIIPAED